MAGLLPIHATYTYNDMYRVNTTTTLAYAAADWVILVTRAIADRVALNISSHTLMTSHWLDRAIFHNNSRTWAASLSKAPLRKANWSSSFHLLKAEQFRNWARKDSKETVPSNFRGFRCSLLGAGGLPLVVFKLDKSESQKNFRVCHFVLSFLVCISFCELLLTWPVVSPSACVEVFPSHHISFLWLGRISMLVSSSRLVFWQQ